MSLLCLLLFDLILLVNKTGSRQISSLYNFSLLFDPFGNLPNRLNCGGACLLMLFLQELFEIGRRPEKILLRTMSENPALEWNSRVKCENQCGPPPLLAPIFHNICSKVNFAPALVYRKFTAPGATVVQHLVAGISFEMNTFTDVTIRISGQQLEALSSLSEQLLNAVSHRVEEK